jgi:hypothetical protein
MPGSPRGRRADGRLAVGVGMPGGPGDGGPERMPGRAEMPAQAGMSRRQRRVSGWAVAGRPGECWAPRGDAGLAERSGRQREGLRRSGRACQLSPAWLGRLLPCRTTVAMDGVSRSNRSQSALGQEAPLASVSDGVGRRGKAGVGVLARPRGAGPGVGILGGRGLSGWARGCRAGRGDAGLDQGWCGRRGNAGRENARLVSRGRGACSC